MESTPAYIIVHAILPAFLLFGYFFSKRISPKTKVHHAVTRNSIIQHISTDTKKDKFFLYKSDMMQSNEPKINEDEKNNDNSERCKNNVPYENEYKNKTSSKPSKSIDTTPLKDSMVLCSEETPKNNCIKLDMDKEFKDSTFDFTPNKTPDTPLSPKYQTDGNEQFVVYYSQESPSLKQTTKYESDKNDLADVYVGKSIKEYLNKHGPLPAQFKKISKGQYMLGEKHLKVSTKNGKAFIRVGGGYVLLSEYLEIYVKNYMESRKNRGNKSK